MFNPMQQSISWGVDTESQIEVPDSDLSLETG
jgi:hypothetical protein